MRSTMLTGALVALIAAAPMAFAATTTEGLVKSFDAKTNTLILQNGISYVLPGGFKDPGLKAGEKVAVVWDMKGAIHEASTVTMVN